MRSRRYRGIDGEGSSYDLSISDLMAALCCVFVLFTIGITTSLKEKNMAANRYNETKVQIAEEIENVLKAECKGVNVTFNKDRLILQFSDDRAFEEGKPYLKNGFKEDLSKIFPAIMKALYNSDKRDDIEEIRIEGFTATDKGDNSEHDAEYNNPYIQAFRNYGEGSDHDYITGFTLSQQRTMHVLSYCMLTNYMKDIPKEEKEVYKKWVREHVSASGYSYTRPLDEEGQEITLEEQNLMNDKQKTISKSKSRRVEFRIKTNADRVVKDLQTKRDTSDEN